jgi:citronellol/citronellal dehydrogenase
LSGNEKSGGGYQSVFRGDLFAGQVALVTGGGTGIGRCTAHELASLGATVVLAARRKDKLEETAAEIEAAGGSADVVELNIRDEELVDRAVASVVEKHGRIDALVNNAGGQFAGPVEKMSANAWRSVVDLNLNGTFLVTHAVYRHSMQQNGGSIVNMLADIWSGYPWMAHMSAARAGIENLSITLSLEWAPSGIRVNCVAPGTILSSGMHTYPPEIQERTVKESQDIALARLGTESEVSAVITFLLSPAAGYITGETVKIDGGSSFQKGRLIRVGQHKKSKPFDAFHLKPDFTGTPFQALYED